MVRINSQSLLMTLFLAVCCVHLVAGGLIPNILSPILGLSNSNSSGHSTHRERVNVLAKAGNMSTEQLEEVRAILDAHRQSKDKEHQALRERQAHGEEFKAMRDRVARMKKAHEEEKEAAAGSSSNARHQPAKSIGAINENANVTDYVLQSDILVSLEDAKRLERGTPLNAEGDNQTMPSWWHSMGKQGGGGGKRASKSEIAQKLKSGKSVSSHAIRKRQAINPSSPNVWPTIPGFSDWPFIPYTYDNTVSAATQSLIDKAVDYWNTYTCIYFYKDTAMTSGVTPRLVYTSPVNSGCLSNVGRQQSVTNQSVIISKPDASGNGDCQDKGVIAHESGHAAGFNHEVVRYDRNNWVNLNLGNIQSGKSYNFDPALTNSQNWNFGSQYDYGSIMHYASNLFGIGGAQTIVSKASGLGTAEWDQSMGSQLTGPSMTDYKVMNSLYNCASFCTSSPLSCSNGGYQNPNDCSSCVCPPGVGGTTCQTPLASPIDQGYAPPGVSNICTGGTISVSSSGSWATLAKTIGVSAWTGTADNDAAWCHWYLQAPSGYHLQIEVQSLSAPGGGTYWFGPGCGAGFTEVRVSNNATTGDWSKTGRRFCGNADLQAQGGSTLIYNSVGRDAIISSYVAKGTRSFTLRYKAL